MKYSIKYQFIGIFVGLMTIAIFLCWIINTSFLETYYEQNKQDALVIVYDSINRAASESRLETDEFDIEFQKICSKYNVNAVILDADSVPIKASDHNPEILGKLLWDNLFGGKETSEILLEQNNYVMEKQNDRRTRTEYIEMWGVLDNGYTFMLRSNLESIKDSATIANRFLLYVGLAVIFSCSIVVAFVSKKITEPILELAAISEKMIHLDFEAKYTGNNRTEIALLGDNINKLSEALQTTISELKTANNELKKDIEKKNEVDEMRKEFLANVSHELKTPIALIQGYAEGLKEGISDDPDSTEFYCDVIIDEAAKMNNMVKKLLTLNQLENGNDIVTMERFDVVSLIKNYLQSAELLAKQHNITVLMEESAPAYVWADEFKVEEVFTNYFSNAVNHCDENKKIIISVKKIGQKVRISVFNTGEKIPEESLEHLWEKFYKVDKARTREYGGSGVGLSIVKAIMESMNQNYGVQNHENGVEFWFELDT